MADPEPTDDSTGAVIVSSPVSHLDKVGVVVLLVPTLGLIVEMSRVEDVGAITLAGLLVDRFILFSPFIIVGALLLMVFGSQKVKVAAILVASVTAASVSLALLAAAGAALAHGLVEPRVGIETIVASVAAVLAIMLGVRHLRSAEPNKLPPLSRAAILAVVAGLLPVAQFWNTTVFLPGQLQAAVTQTVNVIHEATKDGTSLAVVDFTVTNDTDVRMLVLISGLYVCGYDHGALIPAGPKDGRCNDWFAYPIRSNSWIAAHSSLNYRRAIELPASTPVVSVRARISFARGDRLRVDERDPAVLTNVGSCSVLTPMELKEGSRYERFLQRSKYLVYFSRPTGDNYRVVPAGLERLCPDKPDDTYDAAADSLATYYGVTEATVIWEGRPSLAAEAAAQK
jgi:hypothetical protein